MSERLSIDLTPFGLSIGHATDDAGATGLTVIRGIDQPLRAGVAVIGRATGTRDLETASPNHLVGGRIDAVLLTGGSAYGLDAAAGVMRWMEENGRGLPIGGGVVPIVPAAVIFDLQPLGSFKARPTPEMAYEACMSARSREISQGSIGVGTGATVGKILGPAQAMKSGFGCAVSSSPNGVSVAAMVVVNALGDVRDAQGGVLAGARGPDGRFVDALMVLRGSASHSSSADTPPQVMRNTTLAVVASSVPMSSVMLTQLAHAAGAAFYRRITPAGSSFDGDIVFAVSPESAPNVGPSVEPVVIEALAVAALEDAIERAVRLARGRDGIPGLADAHGY